MAIIVDAIPVLYRTQGHLRLRRSRRQGLSKPLLYTTNGARYRLIYTRRDEPSLRTVDGGDKRHLKEALLLVGVYFSQRESVSNRAGA
jgi:hypothetical protein